MEFRILGLIEVEHEGRIVAVGGGRERRLLALLLISANRVVATEQVVDALWPDNPTGGSHALHVHVSRLRRVLREAGRDGVLVTRAPGYLIRVEPGALDAACFEALLEEGRTQAAGGDHRAAAGTFRDALALWRGPALAGLADLPFARAEAARLDEARLACIEERIEADLACGRHAELAGELEGLTHEHPLRERLWGQRMVALYRSGRQVDALAAYQGLRRLLRDELGLEPGVPLSRLEAAILRHDPRLEWSAPEQSVRPASGGAASPAKKSEERRWVTILFAGLTGPEDEQLDPEALQAILDLRRGAVADVVARFGGLPLHAIGDQFAAVFGAPVAHEDDAERAVRAGLALAANAVRSGIETGEILFGPTAGEGIATATGQPLSAAARLQAAAAAGEVLVGEEAHRATHHAVRYEPAPGAHRAVRTAGLPGPRPVSSLVFVGRGEELGVAAALWDRVVAGSIPHLLTAVGPAGIGKTRLAGEFGVLAEARGARMLWGRSLPYAEASAYGAFTAQLKVMAGVLADDSAGVLRDKLARRLSDVMPAAVSDRIADHLGVLVGIGADAPDFEQGAMLHSVRLLLEALGREQPTILVFEDLHWAAPSLLDLVESLAGRLRNTPVLLLGLTRPELFDVRPGWGGGASSHTLLTLSDLPPDDSRALLSALLPDSAEPALVDRLLERAGGNPLFLEELAASQFERGERVAARLPNNVKAIIAARLDGLRPAERRVLLDASVLGTTFRADVLRVLVDNEKLPAILEELEARDLIRRSDPSGAAGDDEFRFKHALTREVAYSTLPLSARRARHAAVAAFLEATISPARAERASLLAHHWRAAGESGLAVPYLLAAAEHAARAWAKGEAAQLFEEARALLPADEVEARRRIGLRCALTRLEAGQYAEAGRELDTLIAELTGQELVEALVARAHCAGFLHEATVLRTTALRAVELTALPGNGELRGPALSTLALSKMLGGEVADALALSEQALAAWPPGNRQSALAYQLGTAGNESYLLGRYEDALRHGRRGFELGKQVLSGESLLWSGAQLALGLTGLGRHEEALSHLTELVSLGHQVETVPVHTAIATNVWAGVHRELVDLTEARRLNHEAIELAARVPFPLAGIQGRVDLLFADLAEGEFGRAELAWGALRAEAATIAGIHQWLVIGRLEAARAEISLGAGHVDRAVEEAGRAVASARGVGRLKYEVAAGVTLGRALARSRARPEAVHVLRAALAGAERLRHPPSVWRAAGALATVAGESSAEGRAAAERASGSISEFAARLSVGRRERFLEAVAVTHPA